MSQTEQTPRVLSLQPSATEIVASLGMEHTLVGRSHSCDYPASVEQLPVCSEPRFSAEGDSRAIHQQATEVIQQALTSYRVDLEKVRSLEPTYIITQSQCEVCAVSTDDLRESLSRLTGSEDITLIDVNPDSLEGVYDSIRRIAGGLGIPDAGERLESDMKDGFDQISRTARRLGHRPLIEHMEWIDPPLAGGHWMMTLIDVAGARKCITDERMRWTSLEALASCDPEKIVIAPCGFSRARTAQEMHLLQQHASWGSLRAVREGEVYLCDGNRYFNRPGPRLVDSARILGEIIHPDVFDPRYAEQGWTRFSG